MPREWAVGLFGVRAWAGAVALVLVAAPAAAARADTILNPGSNDTSLRVSAGADGTPTATDTTDGLGSNRSLGTNPLVGGGGLAITLAGPVSTASYDLTMSLFQIDVGQTLAGGLGDFARAEGDIYFTVDQDASYSLAGSYRVAGPADTIDFTVILADLTAPGSLFATSGTPGTNNLLAGPGLSGDLLANHEYVLRYRLGIANDQTDLAGVPTGAGGDLSLAITAAPGGAVAPLPSAAWAGLLLLSGLGAARLRRVMIKQVAVAESFPVQA